MASQALFFGLCPPSCRVYMTEARFSGHVASMQSRFRGLKEEKSPRPPNSQGGRRTADNWARAVAHQLLRGEPALRNMCQLHSMKLLAITSKDQLYLTKYCLVSEDTLCRETVCSFVLRMRSGLNDVPSAPRSHSFESVRRDLEAASSLIRQVCCKKMMCLSRLRSEQVTNMREHVFRFPKEMILKAISALVQSPYGEQMLCSVATRALFGLSRQSHAKMRELAVLSGGYITDMPVDRRLERENPSSVVIDEVKSALLKFFDSVVDSSGASPEESVVWVDVSGKRGLFRRWMDLAPCDGMGYMSYSTFKRQIVQYQEAKNIRFKRRHRDHSMCKVCIDLEIARESCLGALSAVKRRGEEIPSGLMSELSSIENVVKSHRQEAFARLDSAIAARRYVMLACDWAVSHGAELAKSLPGIFSADEIPARESAALVLFGTHVDAKSRTDFPNLTRAVAEAALTDKFALDLFAFASFWDSGATYFVLDSTHDSKNASMMIDLVFQRIRMLPQGRRQVLLVLDNVGSMNKNGLLVHALEFFCQLGLVEAVLVLFLYPQHGKWLADSSFGRFMSALSVSKPLVSADHVCDFASNLQPNGISTAFLVGVEGRHRWPEIMSQLGVSSTTPPAGLGFQGTPGYVVNGSGSAMFLDNSDVRSLADSDSSDAAGDMIKRLLDCDGFEERTTWRLKLDHRVTADIQNCVDILNRARYTHPIRPMSDYELGRCGYACRFLPYVQWVDQRWLYSGTDVTPYGEAVRQALDHTPPPPPHQSIQSCEAARERVRGAKRKRSRSDVRAEESDAEQPAKRRKYNGRTARKSAPAYPSARFAELARAVEQDSVEQMVSLQPLE